MYVCSYICNYFIIIFTEFRNNGNWGYIVSVHPGQSLHNYQVNMCNLHTTGKLYALDASPYVCMYR